MARDSSRDSSRSVVESECCALIERHEVFGRLHTTNNRGITCMFRAGACMGNAKAVSTKKTKTRMMDTATRTSLRLPIISYYVFFFLVVM